MNRHEAITRIAVPDTQQEAGEAGAARVPMYRKPQVFVIGTALKLLKGRSNGRRNDGRRGRWNP